MVRELVAARVDVNHIVEASGPLYSSMQCRCMCNTSSFAFCSLKFSYTCCTDLSLCKNEIVHITKYSSTLYIGMDEVLAHYACTFENSDLHFHFQ